MILFSFQKEIKPDVSFKEHLKYSENKKGKLWIFFLMW